MGDRLDGTMPVKYRVSRVLLCLVQYSDEVQCRQSTEYCCARSGRSVHSSVPQQLVPAGEHTIRVNLTSHILDFQDFTRDAIAQLNMKMPKSDDIFCPKSC